MKTRLLRRASAGALALTLISATAAFADKIEADADALTTAQPSGNEKAADQPIGSTVAYDLSAAIDETGNASDNVFPGTVSVAISRSGGWIATDAGAPAAFTFTAYDTNAAGKVNITVPCDAEVGDVETMTVVLTAGASSNGRVLNPNSVQLSYEITATAAASGACAANNAAPAITADYDSVTVNEGSAAEMTGTWSDANSADTVTLSASYGVVTQTGGNADGAWAWSATPTDGPLDTQTVTITASDGTAETSASFELTVNNVAPEVHSTIAASVDCRTNASLSLTFADPGVNDGPWSVDVDWGDGSAATEFDASSQGDQATQTHAYTAPGTYAVTVTVTDKDGGSDSDTHYVEVLQTYATTFSAPFDGSSPSNLITNTMKNGRVVPVKIKLYDECALAYVTDPTEVVTIGVSDMGQTSGSADAVEIYADAGQSSAGTDRFRWSTDGFWIYNLDSKNLGLSTGSTYRVNAYVDSVKATTDTWALLRPVK